MSKKRSKPTRSKSRKKATAQRKRKLALHRYTARVKKIRKLTGATYREARKVAKATEGKSSSTLRKHLRDVRTASTVPLLTLDDTENKSGDAGFAVQHMRDERTGNLVHGDRIKAQLARIKGDKVTITITAQKLLQGVKKSAPRTLTRSDVPKKDFYRAYHEMLRDYLESDMDVGEADYDGYGEGIVTTGISAR